MSRRAFFYETKSGVRQKKDLPTGKTMKSIDVGLVFMIILQRVHSIANDCP